MKTYISIAKVIAYFLVILMAAVACNSPETEQDLQAAMLPVSIFPGTNPQKSATLKSGELPKDQVCMVNNTFMGKKQIPVKFENKIYYGCCDMCVEKIKTNRSVRYATDPHSGKQVDKATAFIVKNPAGNDGSVLYFESEQNFHKYKLLFVIH